MNAIAAILGGLGIMFVLLFLGIFVVFYVFRSLGLYTMAKERGIGYAWLAWVPFAKNWIVADLIGGKNATIWGLGFVNWILTLGVLTVFIPTWVGTIIYLVYLVYYWFCYNRLYQVYAKEQSTMYTVLSVLFMNSDAIILFFIRKNQAVIPASSMVVPTMESAPQAE